MWVDLSGDTEGVSLLNDCRYGHDVRDGVIRINAIRSLVRHATHTEAGHQHVTYALYPHTGDWRKGRVMHRGYEFNHPLVAVTARAHEGPLPPTHAFVSVDRPNVLLTVIKQAEEGERLVARGYEIDGQPCTAELSWSRMPIRRADMADMLEKPLSPLPVESGSEQMRRARIPVGAYEIVTVILD
jgi:alpha-mannosidase